MAKALRKSFVSTPHQRGNGKGCDIMRAVVLGDYGGPEVTLIRDVPVPEAGPEPDPDKMPST